MTGTLEQTTDGWTLKFVRQLAHSPQHVWAALVDPQRRATWFPDTMIGEFVPGARLRFVTDLETVPEFSGTVLAVEPERLLEFTWGEDTIRVEIEPTAHGCTLTLRDAISELGKGARDGAGWHVCLDDLVASLDGRTPDADAGERWNRVHPDYVAAFGPRATTIGIPK